MNNKEIGRAGRDGKSSDCIAFFNEQDKIIAEHFIKKASNPKRKEQLIKGFQDVMNFFASPTCKREFILNYFGEKIDRSRTDFHVCCDICRRLQEETSSEVSSSSLSSLALREIQYCNFTAEAELFLQCLVELGNRQGVIKIIKMIRGSNDKTMSNRCKMSKNHGKGKHKKPEFWKGIAAGLEKECFTTRISIETKMVGTVQYKYQAICISQAGLGLNSQNILILQCNS
jgi:ATP-dependent DNA helicase RecQ